MTIEDINAAIDALNLLPPQVECIKVKSWVMDYLLNSPMILLNRKKEIRYMGIPLIIDDNIEKDFKVIYK
jgi:hypothetical protein